MTSCNGSDDDEPKTRRRAHLKSAGNRPSRVLANASDQLHLKESSHDRRLFHLDADQGHLRLPRIPGPVLLLLQLEVPLLPALLRSNAYHEGIRD
jgi:hypothetical protein